MLCVKSKETCILWVFLSTILLLLFSRIRLDILQFVMQFRLVVYNLSNGLVPTRIYYLEEPKMMLIASLYFYINHRLLHAAEVFIISLNLFVFILFYLFIEF